MVKIFKLLEMGGQAAVEHCQPSQNEDGDVRFAMTLAVPVDCFQPRLCHPAGERSGLRCGRAIFRKMTAAPGV